MPLGLAGEKEAWGDCAAWAALCHLCHLCALHSPVSQFPALMVRSNAVGEGLAPAQETLASSKTWSHLHTVQSPETWGGLRPLLAQPPEALPQKIPPNNLDPLGGHGLTQTQVLP